MEKRGYIDPDWTPDLETTKLASDKQKSIDNLDCDSLKRLSEEVKNKLKIDSATEQ